MRAGKMADGRWQMAARTHPSPISQLPSPILIAIAGGSGSGKTWLARQLQRALGGGAARLSLDDFYRDRSRLSPARRARLNFDHPRAIDWPAVEGVLRELLAGRDARLPCYDFKTHCRGREEKLLRAQPVVLVDGLWLLRRPALRRLFALRIFLECPTRTRLRRRLARDRRSRGRSADSVRAQFHGTVEPMHARFVAPQRRWADVVLSGFSARDVRRLAERIRNLRRSADGQVRANSKPNPRTNPSVLESIL